MLIRVLALGAIVVLGLAGCGGGAGSGSSPSASAPASAATRASAGTRASAATEAPGATGAAAGPGVAASRTERALSVSRPKPRAARYPRLQAAAVGSAGEAFAPVVSWQGQPAAWIARTPSGATLLALDERVLELRLHSGTSDAGALGWRFGPRIAGPERRRVVAAFNGGFKLSVGAGGFESYGRVAVPLRDGLGSIVTYADGTTDIGAWHQGVPAPGGRVASVRQNLPLLVDGGRPASSLDCRRCWGATVGGVLDPARSALGITADGRLVWAAGEHLTPAALANALLGAHVVRAVQLDINPAWVAGYLYGHRGSAGPLAAVPIVPGQHGIPGAFVAPWSRDFFTVLTRG